MSESAYNSLGRHFRTPAHPDVLLALGRAHYTFLSLEETVVAILYDAQFMGLDQSRVLMAGGKVDMLRRWPSATGAARTASTSRRLSTTRSQRSTICATPSVTAYFMLNRSRLGSMTTATISRAWPTPAKTRIRRTSCGRHSPTSRVTCSPSRRPSRQRSIRCVRPAMPSPHCRSRV